MGEGVRGCAALTLLRFIPVLVLFFPLLSRFSSLLPYQTAPDLGPGRGLPSLDLYLLEKWFLESLAPLSRRRSSLSPANTCPRKYCLFSGRQEVWGPRDSNSGP